MIADEVTLSEEYGATRDVIVKLAARCDLSCDYCYEFNLRDRTNRSMPRRMSRAVMQQLAYRLGEHVSIHDLPYISVTLHGGEPLLIGIEEIEFLVAQIRKHLPEDFPLILAMQTNGMLLANEMTVNALAKMGIMVGVSMDGPREVHDRHRVDHAGLPSFARVSHGIEVLRTLHPEIFGGILCVIDPSVDPLEAYDTLAAFRPPVVDFLFPLNNWVDLPPGTSGDDTATPYADWLIRIAEERANLTRDGRPVIRILSDLWYQTYGYAVASDQMGWPIRGPLVVATDGSIRMIDGLKSVAEGMDVLRWPGGYYDELAPGVSLSVFNCTLQQAALAQMRWNHGNGIKEIRLEGPLLCDTCMQCPLWQRCGGGYYLHRWAGAGNAQRGLNPGFWNPSVYCHDLGKLHSWMELKMRRTLLRFARNDMYRRIIRMKSTMAE